MSCEGHQEKQHLHTLTLCASFTAGLSTFGKCLLFVFPLHQPGIFAQLMMAAEERPWLWVIYILTVGLPVGLAVLFCWPKVP